jgi:hypothetical protein
LSRWRRLYLLGSVGALPSPRPAQSGALPSPLHSPALCAGRTAVRGLPTPRPSQSGAHARPSALPALCAGRTGCAGGCRPRARRRAGRTRAPSALPHARGLAPGPQARSPPAHHGLAKPDSGTGLTSPARPAANERRHAGTCRAQPPRNSSRALLGLKPVHEQGTPTGEWHGNALLPGVQGQRPGAGAWGPAAAPRRKARAASTTAGVRRPVILVSEVTA